MLLPRHIYHDEFHIAERNSVFNIGGQQIQSHGQGNSSPEIDFGYLRNRFRNSNLKIPLINNKNLTTAEHDGYCEKNTCVVTTDLVYEQMSARGQGGSNAVPLASWE